MKKKKRFTKKEDLIGKTTYFLGTSVGLAFGTLSAMIHKDNAGIILLGLCTIITGMFFYTLDKKMRKRYGLEKM